MWRRHRYLWARRQLEAVVGEALRRALGAMSLFCQLRASSVLAAGHREELGELGGTVL